MSPTLILVSGIISLVIPLICVIFGDEKRMDCGFFVAAGFLGAYGVVATILGALMLLFP